MLIIPLEKSVNWKKPPFITLLLIAVNCFILFFPQSGDDEAIEKAVAYYFESELAEIEFPLYAEDLETQGKFSEAREWQQAMSQNGDNEFIQMMLLMQMEGDEYFMERLRAHELITDEDARFEDWKNARDEYEAIGDESTVWTYGFIPNEHRPVTFFTHMFMHGGTGHLIGNMIFLFLVGFALEMALGSSLFLLFYLLGGLGAVCLFWGAYPDTDIPLVGASGAISALMGLYAVIFGLRKIRFFYFVLVYFDYVKAPAIIMLPLWLLNEFYQLYWGGASNVAYVAHIGGLLAGAALGFGIKMFPKEVDTAYLDESERKDERVRRLQAGMQHLGKLELDKAGLIFSALQRDYPDDREIMRQLYNTLKFSPQSGGYHRIAKRILDLPGNDHQTLNRQHEVFRDYMKTTGGKIRLEPAGLVHLATGFAKTAHPEDAERILLALLRKRKNLPGLEAGLLALADAWRSANNDKKYRYCLKLLLQHFPQNSALVRARLNTAKPQ